MIQRALTALRRIRRLFSRNEWAVKILGLPRFADDKRSGLILIQIDGLARPQLEKALVAGEMPFIRKLLEDEEYKLWSHYSGLPSTTPAVQGELFYGVRSAVPAFTFRDGSAKSHSMLQAPSASMVETYLARKATPLLSGGSSYADVYRGGAQTAAFSVSSIGPGNRAPGRSPLRLLFALLLYGFMLVRVAALVIIELALSVIDFLRGFFKRKSFFKELLFIPTRVGICVLLRELVTASVILDASRGVPVIHGNFLGYDEQSHRRGPSSRFAHWTLRGIDDAVRRIWRSAHRSSRRRYEIWVYSDHGQEHAIPYPTLYDKRVTAAIEEAIHASGLQTLRVISGEPVTIQLQRAKLLGKKYFSRGAGTANAALDHTRVHINAKGPVGSIYMPFRLDAETRERIAHNLVHNAGIPAVLWPVRRERAVAVTRNGRFELPRDIRKVVGEGHPFENEIGRDLTAGIVHNRFAGDLVFLGWRADAQPITFPIENGAHAGPGRDETHGFAVLPDDCPLPDRSKRYVRPADIRAAGLRFLHRPESTVNRVVRMRPRQKTDLRIMTYNVHSCIGLDGRHSYERLARVIARYDPDVVALQELDVGRKRTSGIDQARLIAQALDMRYHFHPSVVIEDEQYGNAILSRLPLKLVKAGGLPGLPGQEPRGAIWVSVKTDSGSVQVLTTHLGLRPAERQLQAEALAGPLWTANPRCIPPLVVCGDFNMSVGSREYRLITQNLRDSQVFAHKRSFQRTWMGVSRLDYLFTSFGLEVSGITVPRTHTTRVASDHYPLIGDLKLA